MNKNVKINNPTLVDAWRQSNPHIVHLLPKRHSFYHTAFRQKPGLCEAKSYAQIATQRDCLIVIQDSIPAILDKCKS